MEGGRPHNADVTLTKADAPVLSVAVIVVAPCAIGMTENVAPAAVSIGAVTPTIVGSPTLKPSDANAPVDRATLTGSGVLSLSGKVYVRCRAQCHDLLCGSSGVAPTAAPRKRGHHKRDKSVSRNEVHTVTPHGTDARPQISSAARKRVPASKCQAAAPVGHL